MGHSLKRLSSEHSKPTRHNVGNPQTQQTPKCNTSTAEIAIPIIFGGHKLQPTTIYLILMESLCPFNMLNLEISSLLYAMMADITVNIGKAECDAVSLKTPSKLCYI
jgi:hypothetical protein